LDDDRLDELRGSETALLSSMGTSLAMMVMTMMMMMLMMLMMLMMMMMMMMTMTMTMMMMMMMKRIIRIVMMASAPKIH
jgi:hypothetical protein